MPSHHADRDKVTLKASAMANLCSCRTCPYIFNVVVMSACPKNSDTSLMEKPSRLNDCTIISCADIAIIVICAAIDFFPIQLLLPNTFQVCFDAWRNRQCPLACFAFSSLNKSCFRSNIYNRCMDCKQMIGKVYIAPFEAKCFAPSHSKLGDQHNGNFYRISLCGLKQRFYLLCRIKTALLFP